MVTMGVRYSKAIDRSEIERSFRVSENLEYYTRRKN